MQNSNESVKSRGILAFAINTKTTDYLSIAKQTIPLAGRVLNLPYTIITEQDIDHQGWSNNRFDVDTNSFVEWKNIGRNCAYDLSPYEETLVLDVDYLVQDAELLKIFDLPWDYILQKRARSLTDEYVSPDMGPHSLRFVWATVFAFRKTKKAKMFFDLIQRIESNYHYYRDLFKVESRNYRNDYAFAMADIILNGFTENSPSIPGWMLNVLQPIKSLEIQNNKLVIKDKQKAYVIPRMNLHIMSKQFLQSDNFKKFVHNVTA